MAEDDIVWRRPESGARSLDHYVGPPESVPPSADFEPVSQEPTVDARTLPPIDDDALDDAEQRAARLTYALGFAALAVMILIACWGLR